MATWEKVALPLVCCLLLSSRAARAKEESSSSSSSSSCSRGAAVWQFWHVFDANKVEVPSAHVWKRPSADSSVVSAVRAVMNQTEDWTEASCGASSCVVRFSPFGESCVRGDEDALSKARWSLERRPRSQLLALAAVAAYLGADRLSEATSLHYGAGVVAGVAGCVLFLVGFAAFSLLGGRSNEGRRRRLRVASLVAIALGYARVVQRYALESVWRVVQDWPVCCGVYVVVSASASVAGTRAILRTGLVPDFVKAGARIAGFLLALNASPSAAFSVVFALSLVASDYVAEGKWLLAKAGDAFKLAVYASSLVAALAALAALVEPLRDAARIAEGTLLNTAVGTKSGGGFSVVFATVFARPFLTTKAAPFFFASSSDGTKVAAVLLGTAVVPMVVVGVARGVPSVLRRVARVPASVVDTLLLRRGDVVAGPPPNILYGHRYLSDAEYADQGKRETNAALAALSRDPKYALWLAENHHRLAAPSPSKLLHDEDDDYDDI